MSGCAARANDLARIFAIKVRGLRSGQRGCMGPPGPHCDVGGYLCGPAHARGLARIFAFAVGGLRSWLCGCAGLPGPLLWRWQMSGWGRAVSGLARIFTIAVGKLQLGLRRAARVAVPPASLLLRSVAFGRAARVRGPARAPLVVMDGVRGLARVSA